jgi:hypothetical protein
MVVCPRCLNINAHRRNRIHPHHDTQLFTQSTELAGRQKVIPWAALVAGSCSASRHIDIPRQTWPCRSARIKLCSADIRL